MTRPAAALALALSLAAGGCASGPEPAPAVLPDGLAPVAAPPITALIGQREALSLTSAQVVALDSIGQALRQENAPFEERVRNTREAWGGRIGRRDRARFLEQVGPALRATWENNRLAAAAVGDVLTPAQRARACEIVRARREELFRNRRDDRLRDDPPGPLTPRTAQRREVDPDTLLVRRPPALPWCAEVGAGGAPGGSSTTSPPPPDAGPAPAPPRVHELSS